MRNDMDPLDYSMLLAAQQPKRRGHWLRDKPSWTPGRLVAIVFVGLMLAIISYNLILTIFGVR